MEDENQMEPPPGYVFITPEMQSAAAAHEQAKRSELLTSMQSFFDSLDPEQTYTLLRMMNIASSNRKLHLPTYWAGELDAMMRHKHKRCPCCGLEAHNKLDPANFMPHEQAAMPIAPLRVDSPDVEKSVDEHMIALNVQWGNQEEAPGSVDCIACETRFPSLADRSNQGLKCPVCELGSNIG